MSLVCVCLSVCLCMRAGVCAWVCMCVCLSMPVWMCVCPKRTTLLTSSIFLLNTYTFSFQDNELRLFAKLPLQMSCRERASSGTRERSLGAFSIQQVTRYCQLSRRFVLHTALGVYLRHAGASRTTANKGFKRISPFFLSWNKIRAPHVQGIRRHKTSEVRRRLWKRPRENPGTVPGRRNKYNISINKPRKNIIDLNSQ